MRRELKVDVWLITDEWTQGWSESHEERIKSSLSDWHNGYRRLVLQNLMRRELKGR